MKAMRRKLEQSSPPYHSVKYIAGSVRPNPSLKRTRTGMPFQAVISFSAFHAMPARAA